MGLLSTTLTRTVAVVSLLALAAATISDFLLTGYWDHNAMATSVVADILVLIVGVAVVNEFLTARARREWQLLADYALIELGETARHIWVQLAQHVGVGQRESLTREELRGVVRSEEGQEKTRELARVVATDDHQRKSLHDLVAELAEGARVRLGRWASVLVESPYPHEVTRFVHLQARLTRLELVLLEDSLNWRPSYEGSGDTEWITARITNIIELGSRLDVELFSIVEHPERWGEFGPDGAARA